MKIKIEIKRFHYSISIEMDDEENNNLTEQLKEKLDEIDQAVKDATGVWHIGKSQHHDLVRILPNGSAWFHPRIVNRIDQLLILMEIAGRKGLENQEAAILLNTPVNTITGYYGQESYKTLFTKTQEGRYVLSPMGTKRVQELTANEVENSSAD